MNAFEMEFYVLAAGQVTFVLLLLSIAYSLASNTTKLLKSNLLLYLHKASSHSVALFEI